MRTPLVATLVSLVVAVWLTPKLRDWALAVKRVDDPTDARRVHTRPIPRIGGVGIAVAFLMPFIGLAMYENQISELIFQDGRRAATFFLGALAALGIGLADDFFQPSARARLAAMVGLGLYTWLGGYGITQLDIAGLEVLDAGPLGAVATVLWIVGVMVAFNFIDGLDGLAAGIALIASLTMFVLAYSEGNVLWMTWTGALAGSLLGFLMFNFNPASVFMGDAGSNFLGYVIAVVALGTSRKESTAVALFIPLIAVGIPILDAVLTMLRRALLRTGMFKSERGHLHHRLIDRGLSHKMTVLVLWLISGVLAVGALTLVLDVAAAKVAAAVVIAAVVFWLSFVTGYIRPYDLRRMYRRGLINQERRQTLQQLCEALATELPEGSGDERLRFAMRRLAESHLITGARLSSSLQPVRDEGVYSAETKGVRVSLPVTLAQLTLLWEDRTTEPSAEELQALQALIDRASSPPDPSDSKSRRLTTDQRSTRAPGDRENRTAPLA